ncbi:hypothetical protein PYCC9005_002086 [Savitreella phatthalungensis]
MLLSGSSNNMRRSESSQSVWDSSDPTRNPAPLPLPEYNGPTAGVKTGAKVGAAHRKLVAERSIDTNLYELVQAIHQNLELLIKRSQNNARDLGRLRGDVRQGQPQLLEDLKKLLGESRAGASDSSVSNEERDAELAKQLGALIQASAAGEGPLSSRDLQQSEGLRETVGRQHDILVEELRDLKRIVLEGIDRQEKATVSSEIETRQEISELRAILVSSLTKHQGKLANLDAQHSSMLRGISEASASDQQAVFKRLDTLLERQTHSLLELVNRSAKDTEHKLESLLASEVARSAREAEVLAEGARRLSAEVDTSALEKELENLTKEFASKRTELSAIDEKIRARTVELSNLEARGKQLDELVKRSAERTEELLKFERARALHDKEYAEKQITMAKTRSLKLEQKLDKLKQQRRPPARPRDPPSVYANLAIHAHAEPSRSSAALRPLAQAAERRIVSLTNVPGAPATPPGKGIVRPVSSGDATSSLPRWPTSLRAEGERKTSFSKRVSALFSSNNLASIADDKENSPKGAPASTSLRSLRSFSLRN